MGRPKLCSEQLLFSVYSVYSVVKFGLTFVIAADVNFEAIALTFATALPL